MLSKQTKDCRNDIYIGNVYLIDGLKDILTKACVFDLQ